MDNDTYNAAPIEEIALEQDVSEQNPETEVSVNSRTQLHYKCNHCS